MKRYILVLLLFACSTVFAQSAINNYKYVIVPERFGFQKEVDQYSLNTSTKQLLENKGFTVYFDNSDLPAEIANNKCVALTTDVSDKSGMFSTKLILILKDCRGTVVFQSAVGTSREKDYAVGYSMALKDAFASLDKVSYAYNGANGKTERQAANTPIAVNANTGTVTVTTPAIADKATVTEAATTTTAPVASNQQVKTLYAQVIPNGFQLIDTTPKKVLTLLKTSSENYFIANNDTVNGIVVKVNGDYFFEYYSEGKLISEKLAIKF